MPITVLIVDDSSVIRGLMNRALASRPEIAVAGAASNGSMAITMARELKPDIIVLDIEMPVMDGLTALPELLRVSPGSRIIIASTLTVSNAATSLEALSLGAVDYLAKPSAKTGEEVTAFYRELTEKILVLGSRPLVAAPPPPSARRKSAIANRLQPGEPLCPAGVKALAIACSTGGPQALASLFEQLNGHLNDIPIFITQHMPPHFTTILAENLSRAIGRPCQEAATGIVVLPGHVYLAPGDYHMLAQRQPNGKIHTIVNQDPPEHFCRPAADPMLRSLSAIYKEHLVLIVLTGMGQDALDGARHVVRNGGSVIAQDAATSIVYGMPKAVAENHLCKAVLPLQEIAPFLIRHIDGERTHG